METMAAMMAESRAQHREMHDLLLSSQRTMTIAMTSMTDMMIRLMAFLSGMGPEGPQPTPADPSSFPSPLQPSGVPALPPPSEAPVAITGRGTRSVKAELFQELCFPPPSATSILRVDEAIPALSSLTAQQCAIDNLSADIRSQ